jgi:ParB family chromosome partitioning protein
MKRTTGIKKANLSVSSGLNLPNAKPMTKTIKFGKENYTARHVIVSAKEIESKTIAHHLNTRNQDSLTMEAVRDIYPLVLEEGIKQEGVAYYNTALDRYELFDASRRRFCGIHAQKDLPLWVLDELPSAKDILAYVDLTQTVKLLSWREVGERYLSLARDKDIDVNDLERMSKEFNVSTETVRKKVNAAKLNKTLIESFPDCQGIPTSFYAKIGKIERNLAKIKLTPEAFVENEYANFVTDSVDVSDIQAKLLQHYESKLDGLINGESKQKVKVTVEDLASFENKDTYARIKTSANGRKKSLEFSRLPKELTDDIEAYIRQKLNELS